jgi:predicted TIM-barrel fold metal-dependent hydrolase
MNKDTSLLTRRRFLSQSATTGIVASCEDLAAADSSTQPPCIDCQSHLFCPEIVAFMEGRKEDPLVYRNGEDRYVKKGDWHRKILPKHMDVSAKLADMDAAGIQITALSINDPGPEWFGEHGVALARTMNDFVAEIVRQHPTRFIGLCVLPLQDMDASFVELDRCIHKLGMKGILLYTNLAGRFPDEPPFRPLFARAVEWDVPILLHPAKPVTTDAVKGYEMTSSLGNMFEDTIGLTRIIMSGILDQHPNLKLVCPHLGGTLPFIIGRIDHQTQVLKRGPKYLRRTPSAYLKQIWLDIVSPLPAAMRFCYDMLGADRLLYASDHPWVDPQLIRDDFLSLGLPQQDVVKILGENALRLFRLA